jgi:hypothetical protein
MVESKEKILMETYQPISSSSEYECDPGCTATLTAVPTPPILLLMLRVLVFCAFLPPPPFPLEIPQRSMFLRNHWLHLEPQQRVIVLQVAAFKGCAFYTRHEFEALAKRTVAVGGTRKAPFEYSPSPSPFPLLPHFLSRNVAKHARAYSISFPAVLPGICPQTKDRLNDERPLPCSTDGS